MTIDQRVLQSEIKPPSAVCPWCDQEVYIAHVHGIPKVIRPCAHSQPDIDTTAKPMRVTFVMRGEVL